MKLWFYTKTSDFKSFPLAWVWVWALVHFLLGMGTEGRVLAVRKISLLYIHRNTRLWCLQSCLGIILLGFQFSQLHAQCAADLDVPSNNVANAISSVTGTVPTGQTFTIERINSGGTPITFRTSGANQTDPVYKNADQSTSWASGGTSPLFTTSPEFIRFDARDNATNGTEQPYFLKITFSQAITNPIINISGTANKTITANVPATFLSSFLYLNGSQGGNGGTLPLPTATAITNGVSLTGSHGSDNFNVALRLDGTVTTAIIEITQLADVSTWTNSSGLSIWSQIDNMGLTISSACCNAGTTAPAITPTTASNTCPATTVDLSALANTGTTPVGATLIWSTHNLPTTVADTLTNLAVSTAGKYYALYYDKVNNCYSPADSVIVTFKVAPSAPTTTVTQPTCSVTTGTITVTAPSSGVTYSFDNGATYQASNIKSGLAAGATYQVVVKDNTSGCISTATPSVINAQPATPTISNIAKIDPSVASCPSLNNGTITVTATGSNLQYSKDNGATWQASNSFTGLIAGSYTIKVKDNVSGCEVVYASNPVVLTAPTCTLTEICNNLIDDDGDGKIDCEDADCTPCSCTTISNITYDAPTTNPSASHTRRYVLTNDNGVIQKVSTTPIFLGCPDGQYRVYTVWYIAATYTPPLSMGSNISTVTGTSVVVSLPKLEKVCSPTVQYETRILEKAYDCINKKVTIQVQVRAKPNTGTFLMGDANYRFDYNSTQLTNPVIVSQEHFSNVAPASDANYVPQSLNGSSEGPTIGTVSLNTVYGGGGLAAQTVDSVWQTVSCIQFDKRDTALCYAFRWHDNLENPSTGMTGLVLNGGGTYDVYDVKSGGYYGNLQQCVNTLVCCTTLDIKVILEGPYNSTTGLMSTVLNQRGLLPGQTPLGQFGLKTPDGQPFNTNPWNYTGTEAIINYPTTVVDWVLVSLRTDSLLATSTVLQKAGLLHNDGHVSFLDSCWSLVTGQKYFAVVEHRNHIGVMSNVAFIPQSNIVIDFTAGDGYIRVNPPTTGQKQVGSKWVMLTGDGRKELQVTNFDINFNDQQRWKVESGIFDQYNYSDFNLDADTNFFDSNLWKKNNGRYSGVPH